MLCVEHRVGDLGPLQHFAQHLRFINGDRTHKYRLPPVIEFLDLLDHGLIFFPLTFIDDIGKIFSDHRHICRHHNDFQFIDIMEFGRFRIGRSRHSCKFIIHAKKVLKRHRGEGLVFLRHTNALLCLHGLVQPVTPTTARHHASGELVHNDHLIVLDHILDVLFKQPVGLDKLLGGVEEFRGLHIALFQLLEKSRFFLFTEAFILSDPEAFLINIGEYKITQTTAGQQLDPFFG